MSDDLLERVRARARDNAFWRYLGVEVTEAGEGRVRLLVRARDEIRNAPGAPLHGGVFAALTDMAVGGALSTMHDASAGGVGRSPST
jgi:acyl-coenzyme A thioesterase PaaI-like protein